VLDWLQRNKALHAIVLPSIIIDGSTHLQDQRKINLFVKGACADGCGLISWARAFADLTGLDEQASLLHKVVTAKLRAGSTCEQLRAHASLMLERWACIEKRLWRRRSRAGSTLSARTTRPATSEGTREHGIQVSHSGAGVRATCSGPLGWVARQP
jgi:hypothetical protein